MDPTAALAARDFGSLQEAAGHHLRRQHRLNLYGAKILETKPTKYNDIKYHFLLDHVASGSLNTEPIRSQDQLADTFTQPLESSRFKKLWTNLG